jgi:DNA-binding transcriptional ArsR family regulator
MPDEGSGASNPLPEPLVVATDRKERILQALGDPASRQILALLNDAPLSVQELQAANHVPQSSLYRKLHELQDLGLVAVQTTAFTADGKRVDMFRSRIEEVRVEMRGGVLHVNVRHRDLSAERLRFMWGRVRREGGRP